MKVKKEISSVLFLIGLIIVLGAVGSSDIDIISEKELVIRCAIGGTLMLLASIGSRIGGKSW